MRLAYALLGLLFTSCGTYVPLMECRVGSATHPLSKRQAEQVFATVQEVAARQGFTGSVLPQGSTYTAHPLRRTWRTPRVVYLSVARALEEPGILIQLKHPSPEGRSRFEQDVWGEINRLLKQRLGAGFIQPGAKGYWDPT